MAQCTSCSAPLPPDSILCEYCGSRNDTDLAGIHHYTTHETDSGRTCPRCHIPLETLNLGIGGKFLIERCHECLGLFFDPGELEALLEASVKNVFEIQRSRLDQINQTIRNKEYGITYIQCPVCAKIMNRVSFGTKSGVVIDRCKAHGVWLDGGELRHLLEWMKAGGRLLHQERQEEIKKQEEEKERRNNAKGGAGSVYSEYATFEMYGNSLRSQDADLFGMIKKAVNWFLK